MAWIWRRSKEGDLFAVAQAQLQGYALTCYSIAVGKSSYSSAAPVTGRTTFVGPGFNQGRWRSSLDRTPCRLSRPSLHVSCGQLHPVQTMPSPGHHRPHASSTSSFHPGKFV